MHTRLIFASRARTLFLRHEHAFLSHHVHDPVETVVAGDEEGAVKEGADEQNQANRQFLLLGLGQPERPCVGSA